MILFIYRSKAAGNSVCEAVGRMGIPSRITTPEGAFSAVNDKYSAIIVSFPADELMIYDTEFFKTLKTFSMNCPMFAICPKQDTLLFRETEVFDKIFTNENKISTVISMIAAYHAKNGMIPLTSYCLSGIDASVSSLSVRYFGDEIELGGKEKLILRTLISFYPSPISAKEIIKYAFSPAKAPQASNVRAHICSINRKFKAVSRRKIIEMSDSGEGYLIQTAEILNEKEKSIK